MDEMLNVGDAVEDMAKCMTRAALCAITLDVMPDTPSLSDEVIERARLDESGLIGMANELAAMAATFEEANMIPIFTDQDPEKVLEYWYVYLDQVVQYCAKYTAWAHLGYINSPTIITGWIHVWGGPLLVLRTEVARLIRNRAATLVAFPAGRLPKEYGLKTA